LDSFEGQISLSDILNVDIAFLKELYTSRNKLIEAKIKAKEDALNNAASSSNDSDGYY
jgi:hypothetical protein